MIEQIEAPGDYPCSRATPSTSTNASSDRQTREARGRDERIRILHCLRAPVGGLFRHVLDLSARAGGAAATRSASSWMPSSADPADERPARGDRAPPAARRLPRSHEPPARHRRRHRRRAPCAICARLARRRCPARARRQGRRLCASRRPRCCARERRRVVTVYTPHGGSLHYPPASPQGALYIAHGAACSPASPTGSSSRAPTPRALYAAAGRQGPRARARHHQRAAARGLRAARHRRRTLPISCSSASCGT